MNKNNPTGISGLKCDNPTCGYGEDTPRSEYAKSINKPCPKCGSNLLTQDDYDALCAVELMLQSPIETITPEDEKTNFELSFDGSGKAKLKEVPKSKNMTKKK